MNLKQKQRTSPVSLFRGDTVSATVSLACVILLFYLSLTKASLMADGVRAGVSLFFSVIFPALFPFMLLSDATIKRRLLEGFPLLPKVFSRLFHIKDSAFPAYLIGLFCGFPLGAKSTVKLYEEGAIEKEEAEFLLSLSSNPSLSFLIGAVGLGLLGSAKNGLCLLVSCWISSLIAGMLFRPSNQPILSVRKVILRQTYSFTDSIQSSLKASFSLFGFLTVFSVIAEWVEFLPLLQSIKAFLLSILEIGNAAKAISSFFQTSPVYGGFLLGFSIGFSGLSVYLQIASISKEANLSVKRYLPQKAVQGVFCGLLFLLLTFIIR